MRQKNGPEREILYYSQRNSRSITGEASSGPKYHWATPWVHMQEVDWEAAKKSKAKGSSSFVASSKLARAPLLGSEQVLLCPTVIAFIY